MSATDKRRGRTERRADSVQRENYERLYNDDNDIYATEGTARRSSISPPPPPNRNPGQDHINNKEKRSCVYRIPSLDGQTTQACTSRVKHADPDTCHRHKSITDMLGNFCPPPDASNEGEKFLHFYGGVSLTSKGLSSIYTDSYTTKDLVAGMEEGTKSVSVPTPKVLDNLLDKCFEGITYLVSGARVKYVLPETIVRLNNNGSVKDYDSFGVNSHTEMVTFFDKFQETEKKICSVGEDELDLSQVLLIEGSRGSTSLQTPLKSPMKGTHFPFGWKYNFHKAGDAIKTFYYPPARVRIPCDIRHPNPGARIMPTNPTHSVYTYQASGSQTIVKVQRRMYSEWQKESQEVSFLSFESKPSKTVDISLAETTNNDVFMGLIPMFFEKVEGNKRLMDMLRGKMDKYGGGDRETQIDILRGILKALREKGARILRVKRDSLGISENNEEATFDDVGGSFFIGQLAPFLYEYHLNVVSKEGKYSWGDLPIHHQVVVRSLLAESGSDEEANEEDLLDAMAAVFGVRKAKERVTDATNENDNESGDDSVLELHSDLESDDDEYDNENESGDDN